VHQFPSHLNLETTQIVEQGMVNYMEHGSLYVKIPDCDSGLAIDEVCPTIRSHLNF